MIREGQPVKMDLRYLVEDCDRHGNVRVYFRRSGKPKIRLYEAPGTPAFLEEYRRAVAGDAATPATPRRSRQPQRDSLRWLCNEYYGSAEFKGLGPSTRHARKLILDRLCQSGTNGDKPFREMESRHVRKLRDQWAGREAELPEAANSLVKALRQLFKWAIEAKGLKQNVARDVPYLEGNPDGFHTWTVEEVERYERRHPIGTKARLALALLMFTGVRRSDVVRFGRQMAQGGWLRFTEAKGARRNPKQREIPILPQLQAVIDSTPAGNLTYLVTEFDKPFTVAGFGNWFRKRCDEAGLPQCSAHGVRKAGATIAAENGATEHQLMAIFGWDSPKQAGHYTRKVSRKRLAGDAMHMLVPRQSGNESVPLSRAMSKVGQKRGSK
jgi:integrase